MFKISGAGSGTVLLARSGDYGPTCPLAQKHRPKAHSKVLGIHAIEGMESSNQTKVIKQHYQSGLKMEMTGYFSLFCQ